MFAVHHYTANEIEDTQDQESAASLLLQGQQLLHHATATKGWRNVTVVQCEPPNLRQNHTLGLISSPCTIRNVDAHLSSSCNFVLSDWKNAQITEMDVSELKEFEGTDFSRFRGPRKDASKHTQIVVSRKRKRAEETTTTSTQDDNVGAPAKKVKPDYSIHSVVPQPHYFPHPLQAADPKPITEIEQFVKPYHKSEPLPVSPYTSTSVKKLLNRKYARVAWVIPVRGALPWSNASKGTLISEYPPIQPDNGEVHWTQDSLRMFWEFLTGVYKAQTFGPISLSYHVAPSTPSSKNLKLLSCDHIKIRCDAVLALHVRTVIDVWKYKYMLEREDKPTEQVAECPLRNAKLVLVDHCGKGLIIL